MSSFSYEKALSIDWNGQLFILTIRKETPISSFGYLYSYDGLNWFSRYDVSNNPVLTSNNSYNVRWTGSNFSMIGNISTSQGNTSLRSFDGLNYSINNNSSFLPPLFDMELNAEFPNTITFPKSTTLALGGISTDTNKIAYSLDEGNTWQSSSNASSIFSISANAANWNGKIWVAVGSGTGNTIATSTDGNNWVGRGKYIFTTAGIAIEWSKEQKLWVAGGSGTTNSLAYSTDGIFWIGIGTSILSAVYDVKCNGSMWVAVGDPAIGSTKRIAYSYDGKSWFFPTQNNLFDLSATSIAWNGEFWAAAGNSSSSNNYYSLATSYDGVVWNMQVLAYYKIFFNNFFSNPKTTNMTIITSKDGYNSSIPNNNFGYANVDSNGKVNIITTGTVTTSVLGAYTLYTFTGNGTFQTTSTVSAQTLIVGGGGGGGRQGNGGGGGGGAGAVGIGSLTFENNINYTITIGNGGSAANNTNSYVASNGGNSTIIGGTITQLALGGGRGKKGYELDPPPSGDGGSGGGSGTINVPGEVVVVTTNVPSNALTYYGNRGGTSTAYTASGGGGGGGGAVSEGGSGAGAIIRNAGGAGGNGILWTVNNNRYGGGGGGGGNPRGIGGSGGGGNGCGYSTTDIATPGTQNTGGGGGGGLGVGGVNWDQSPASGGSGIVIIAVLSSNLFVPIYTNITQNTTITPINTSFYNGSQYFIAGNSYISSPDTRTWSSVKNITGMTSINKFAWNNPNQGIPKIQPATIALGEGNNTIAWSPDGIYWKGLGKTVFSTRANRVVWNGTLWCGVGTGNYWVATSYDGINWVGRDNYLMQEGFDIAWNGTVFVAVGTGGLCNICISKDGINWYGAPNCNAFFPTSSSAIVWTGKVWIAYGSGGQSTTIYSSSQDAWFWNTTPVPNLVISSASSAVLSPGFSAISASSNTATFLPSNAFDLSLNPTSSTDWRSDVAKYTATTGVYSGSSSTLYNYYLSLSGEFIQINFNSPVNIRYYQLSWFLNASTLTTIPSGWVLLGSNTNNNSSWIFIDNFQFNTPTPPNNLSGKYPFFIKLQNISNNTISYQYYRIVFPSIFPSGSLTYTYVSEIDFFQTNANSNIVSRYLKPIVTRTHVLHQTNIIRFSSLVGSQNIYTITDLNSDLVGNCFINNGNYTNNLLTNAGSSPITASCFDGMNLVLTSQNGNIININNQNLNTNLNIDVSFNGNLFNSRINGNIFAACYNGKRILLGGSGGNIITYNTLSTIPGAGGSQWTPALNTSNMMSSVYDLASNSGYGFVSIPNTIYFSPGERVSIVAPKSYNPNINSKNTISMSLQNSNLIQNIVLPTTTVINYYLGLTGVTGPIYLIPGDTGETGTTGRTGNTGPVGATGETGDPGIDFPTGITGFTGYSGNTGGFGPTGITGSKGLKGLNGCTGPFGSTGPTGVVGPVQLDKWIYSQNSIYSQNNVLLSSVSNENFSLFVNGNTNIRNTITSNKANIRTSLNISNQMTIGNYSSQNLHQFIETRNQLNSKLNVIGNVFCSNAVTSNPTNVKYINISQTAHPIYFPIYIDNHTISINYIDKNKNYTINIASSPINQNFLCVLENTQSFSGQNKIYHLSFHIHYENIIPTPTNNLFYCSQLSISGSIYNILFTGGNPTIPYYTKNIIQKLEIVVFQNSIWKVLSTITKFN